MKTGIAFPDYIQTEKIKRHNNKGFFNKSYELRSFLLPLLLIVAILILFGRLFYLQVIKGVYYRFLADNNRIRTIIVRAPRGIIFDRSSKPLIFNIPGFRETINGKTKIVDNAEALSLIAKEKKDLEVDQLRSYHYKEIFSHTLGYIGQISEEELKKPEYRDYKIADLVGKTGIEQKYERKLKGVDGKRLVEVDSAGKIIRKLGQTDPIAGENITTTLDIRLQKAVYNAMQDVRKGAAIVSNINGEILSLVSKPSFDPNLFTQGKAYLSKYSGFYSSIDQVLSDEENQPMLNRAISGLYAPGSTFKLIVAAAGLENNIIDKNFVVEDTGILKVGEFSFANWYFTKYGKTEGLVNVVEAIKRSNDIFFYKASEKIGVDKISAMANKFGIGKTLGIDLAGEAKGTLPTTAWKKKAIGDTWFLGDTYHFGIGQGYLLVTPLHVNIWTQAIANRGVLSQPHFLKSQKSILRQAQDKNQKFLSDKTISLIRQGMIESCSPGGVAWPLFELKVGNEKLKVACKTGTAEHGGKETLPHAWITLFAPAFDPQIVVTVLSEESGEGSNVAAPIAKKILEEWFSR